MIGPKPVQLTLIVWWCTKHWCASVCPSSLRTIAYKDQPRSTPAVATHSRPGIAVDVSDTCNCYSTLADRPQPHVLPTLPPKPNTPSCRPCRKEIMLSCTQLAAEWLTRWHAGRSPADYLYMQDNVCGEAIISSCPSGWLPPGPQRGRSACGRCAPPGGRRQCRRTCRACPPAAVRRPSRAAATTSAATRRCSPRCSSRCTQVYMPHRWPSTKGGARVRS